MVNICEPNFWRKMILELVHTLQDPKSLMRLRHLKKGAAWTDFVLPDVCWYRLIHAQERYEGHVCGRTTPGCAAPG